MLDVLLSSGSFGEKRHNLNMFLLSTTLSYNLEQLGIKNYGDDMKIKNIYLFCGNNYLSIKGAALECYKKIDDRKFPIINTVDVLIK